MASFRWLAFFFILSMVVTLVSASTDGLHSMVDIDQNSASPASDGVHSMSVVTISSQAPSNNPSGGGPGVLSKEDFCSLKNGTLTMVNGTVACSTSSGIVVVPEQNESFINSVSRLGNQALGQPLLLLLTVGIIGFILYRNNERKKKEELEREKEFRQQGRQL